MLKIANVRGRITRRRMLFTAAAASSALVLPLPAGASTKKSRSARGGELDIDRFVEECIAANRETEPQVAVLEVLKRAIQNPSAVLKTLGEPTEAGIRVLHAAWTG